MDITKYMTASLLALALCACGDGGAGEGITGRVTMEGYEGRQVYLETTGATREKVDSALVEDGKFAFTLDDARPEVYMLVLKASDDDQYPITLPVVSEKGHVKVSMGELVLTSGTPMNDSLQDFLLAVSHFTDKVMGQQSPDMRQVRADFAKLVESTVHQNLNTPVGIYIYRMYADRLDEAQKEQILEAADESFRKAVE